MVQRRKLEQELEERTAQMEDRASPHTLLSGAGKRTPH